MPRHRSDAAPSETSPLSLFAEAGLAEPSTSDASVAEKPKKSAKKEAKTPRKPRSSAKKTEQTENSEPSPSLIAADDAPQSLALFGALTEETAEKAQLEKVAETVEDAQPEKVAETVEDAQPEKVAKTVEDAQSEKVAETVEDAQPEKVAETVEDAQSEEIAETAEIAQSEETALPPQSPVDAPEKSKKTEKPAASSTSTAYQVVARRYRPQAFGELIGQETVARALSNAIETNRVGHAYLFTGARGVGKTSCARIFAKALNCVDGPTVRPCLVCDSCVAVSTGDDVDVIEIDGASNRGVDEIRQLRQNATIAPSRSLYKIYIIDEVHMLTREAFNALLKTLEEPPARVKFIFCTTEPNKIPITILSRCQRFDFSGIASGSIAERLAQIAAQEGAEAEDGVFEILARRANGSMRDAQSLLEQLLSFAPTYISQNDARGMLGSVDDKKLFDLLDATVAGNAARVFEIVADAAAQGVDFGVLVEQTLGVYRDLMVVANGCGARELMYSPVARLPELQEIAAAFGIRRILASLQILDQTAQRMRFSAQSRILAELAFARLCLLDSFQALETLIDRLRSGSLPELGSLDASPVSPETDGKKKNNALAPPLERSPRLVSPVERSSETPVSPRSSLGENSPATPANLPPQPRPHERPVVPTPTVSAPERPVVPTPTVSAPERPVVPTPDAPPLDEEPPYFLDENGVFETEVVLPDDVLPPRSSRSEPSRRSEISRFTPPPVRSGDAARSFQAPSLVGRPLASRPSFRNEKTLLASQSQNRDVNGESSRESTADAPWLALSPKELAAAWLDATRGLGCILPTQAATFCQVAVEAPNVFIVYFPGSKRGEREYCESAKDKIGASLAQRLGAPASVRCLLDPSKTDADILAPASERAAANSFNGSNNYSNSSDFNGSSGFNGAGGAENGGALQRPPQRRDAAPAPGVRDLYRQVAQNEAVVELRELFEAELGEIKPPRPSAGRRSAFAPPVLTDVVDDPDDSDDD